MPDKLAFTVHVLSLLTPVAKYFRTAAMDLDTAIEETTMALNLFLNNKFNEAKSRMEPWYVYMCLSI